MIIIEIVVKNIAKIKRELKNNIYRHLEKILETQFYRSVNGKIILDRELLYINFSYCNNTIFFAVNDYPIGIDCISKQDYVDQRIIQTKYDKQLKARYTNIEVFCIKEAILKKENLTLSDIKRIDIQNYINSVFTIAREDRFIAVCADKHSQIKFYNFETEPEGINVIFTPIRKILSEFNRARK
ncbi:hypothetical protein EV693_10428 [Nicoletella semolina]|uniref:Uncharacterized protein n=1 Tax=Nicoletella semolina TaxID=271160 RepID=A0A4R2N9S9_9PAST|nr:hypothetical protein [Nicoletella semolina]MDH2925322.1 hypothetical protein [Nicoletella semolina]TCP17799.1 hypothetical protein EV693_10428 [Nicoletella semolina]